MFGLDLREASCYQGYGLRQNLLSFGSTAVFEFSRLPINPHNRPKAFASVIVATSATIVGLMSIAAGRDDAGVRQFFVDQANHAELQRSSFRATVPPDAYSLGTPLTIRSLDRARPLRYVSHKVLHKVKIAARPVVVAKTRVGPLAARPALAAAKPALFAADPHRPIVVSIYEDTTLRRGDAVMTATGLRVFAGSRKFPYRPEDFTTLKASRDIKMDFRRALMELDQNPYLRG